MTPTEREWGKVETEIEQLIHRSRGDRLIMQALSEQVDRNEAELNRLKARIHAAIGVVIFLSGAVAWLVEVAVSLTR